MRDGMVKSDHILLKIAALVLAALVVSAVPSLVGDSRRVPLAVSVGASVGGTPSLAAYRSLGTWIDIYDKSAWADPDAAVADMAGHGVRTLFLQTGNSRSKGVVFDPSAQAAFIQAAHARGMEVVAWYLPAMTDMTFDYDRVAAAIGFKTSDGQGFDSFALDIESSKIRKVSARNRALDVLSSKIRGLVGPSYPLGAIIPSPVGIAKQAGFWDAFPYGSIAKTYDVFVPMAYYTYHGKGAAAAGADALGSVRILRAQPGCANVPVHLIGGIAQKTTTAEVRAFAKAAQASGCVGASIYGWVGTTPGEWAALREVVR